MKWYFYTYSIEISIMAACFLAEAEKNLLHESLKASAFIKFFDIYNRLRVWKERRIGK